MDVAREDPDFSIRDLYNSIADGNFPSWSMYIQVMSVDDAIKREENPFDVTKVWSHKEFPLIPVGQFKLNKNPVDYFAQIEQSAFSPGNFVPGIDSSPDKMLQGRLFSYPDTHRHRVGANFHMLPVNNAYRYKLNYP